MDKGHVGDNINSVLCREVVLMYVQNVLELRVGKPIFGTLTCTCPLLRGLYLDCVPITEGPLSEVPLYIEI